jgi:Sap-like sulfolipid-1-addressing protein
VWITLLVMALAASVEPFRVGMTVLMLNRPRPILQLLAFLCGGFAMGTTVGLVVLFALRPALLGSAHFSVPRMQIVIGGLALVIAAVLTFGIPLRGSGGAGGPATWMRRLLTGRSLWVAAVAGLGIALPSVDYLAALTLILASGIAATEQIGALLVFNIIAFALVEIPLVAYLLAPERTHASMTALHEWIRSRRRREVAALLAGVGCVFVGVGVVGL